MIRDTSYNTVRYGMVESYRGWECSEHGIRVACGASGPAEGPVRDGHIRVLPLSEATITMEVRSYSGQAGFSVTLDVGTTVHIEDMMHYPTEQACREGYAIPTDMPVRYRVPGFLSMSPCTSWVLAWRAQMASPVSRMMVRVLPWMRACIRGTLARNSMFARIEAERQSERVPR